MKALLMIGLGCVLCLLGSTQAGEKKDNASKIVGSWEVVKSDENPAGSSVVFSKDGKLTFTPKGKEGKEGKKLEATYKVDGNKLTTTRKENGKDEVNHLTIQTLDESKLVTVNDKGKTDELKRVQSK